MKNREKFSKEILELLIKNHDIGILKTGKPCMCKDTNCDLCIFYDTTGICTDTVTLEYMEQEYVEPRIHWEDVPVDTPVYIYKPNMPGHFASYDAQSNLIKVFDNGRTSFTISNKHDIEHEVSGYLPSYVTLAREEDIKKYYRR